MQTAPLIAQPVPETWDRSGLPGWAYHSPALLALEKAELFATHWQIVCHVSDLPGPGAWVALDIGDDRALVIRGQDGTIRAVHNLCRHRGARVAPGAQGQCRNALVCPFHGWVYNLDGTLRGPARPRSFEADLDRAQYGLKPMESEIWMGFVFVRCRPGPQGIGRRDPRRLRRRTSPTTVSTTSRRPARPGPPRSPSTGSRSATSTTRATTSPWPTRRCRTSTARTTATTSAPRASPGRSRRSTPTAAAAGASATT